MAIYNRIPHSEIFELYNQSGMDHELIGHEHNFYANNRYDETAARETQISFAEYRSEKIGENWTTILTIMPAILKLP